MCSEILDSDGLLCAFPASDADRLAYVALHLSGALHLWVVGCLTCFDTAMVRCYLARF
jgi:hypothetical protein